MGISGISGFMGRLNWDPRTDDSRLRRLLRNVKISEFEISKSEKRTV